MMSENKFDVLSRLNAMRAQEKTTRCTNYFKRRRSGDTTTTTNNKSTTIDQSSRMAMVTWIQQVQSTLSFSSETTWIAMSFFDRYLSSGRGNSNKVLKSRCKFQLAAITSFYLAVKIYEPVVVPVDMLLQICHGTYIESDILSMEKDILCALGWRVSCFTPLDFARHLMQLLSKEQEVSASISDSILESCAKHLEYATTKLGFSCIKPSIVGISCLASSLTECNALSDVEKQAIWDELSESCDFDLSSKEVLAAQQYLLSHVVSLPCKQYDGNDNVSKSSKLSRQQSNGSVCSTSSPVCVVQMARQA